MRDYWQARPRVAVALLLLGLVGCPQRTAVWVEPGSTRERLLFRIADRRHGSGHPSIGVFRVDRCGAWEGSSSRPQPMWGAGASGGTETLELVEYGVMPRGYERLLAQADTALTLTPGCYEAMVSGSGRTVFDVHSDGSVVERAATR